MTALVHADIIKFLKTAHTMAEVQAQIDSLAGGGSTAHQYHAAQALSIIRTQGITLTTTTDANGILKYQVAA
jgi:hypothetical protein